MSMIKFRLLNIAFLSLFLLFSSVTSASVVTGNSKGNIIVEEFFDYQCPHCRIMLENTEKLAHHDHDVKLVTRVVPLLDSNSWTIARAVLASRNQGKYNHFHHLLMERRSYISYADVMSLAKKAGLDISRLRRDMSSKAIAAELNDNINASRRRGVEIIPAIFAYRVNNPSAAISIVGDKSYADLQSTLANI